MTHRFLQIWRTHYRDCVFLDATNADWELATNYIESQIEGESPWAVVRSRESI